MAFWGKIVKCGRVASSAVQSLFKNSKTTAKFLQKIKAKPVPVGQPAASAAEKPKGFFDMLDEMNADKNYREYKEVFNQGIPFDHYMYMH